MENVDRASRWRRRVVGVATITRNSPNHRWDTIELALECGHHHPILRLHKLNERISLAQKPSWGGSDLPCTKCMSLDRIRAKLRRPPGRIAG
jgi:hypothetical protein